MNTVEIAGLIFCMLLFGAAIMFWSTRGYGKVSPDAYEVSKALYGACLAKNEQRLQALDVLLDGDADGSFTVSEAERKWLEAMIDTAKDGDWKAAAQSARRMMEDQVEY